MPAINIKEEKKQKLTELYQRYLLGEWKPHFINYKRDALLERADSRPIVIPFSGLEKIIYGVIFLGVGISLLIASVINLSPQRTIFAILAVFILYGGLKMVHFGKRSSQKFVILDLDGFLVYNSEFVTWEEVKNITSYTNHSADEDEIHIYIDLIDSNKPQIDIYISDIKPGYGAIFDAFQVYRDAAVDPSFIEVINKNRIERRNAKHPNPPSGSWRCGQCQAINSEKTQFCVQCMKKRC